MKTSLRKNNKSNQKRIALAEIFILIIAIFGFVWIVGGSLPVVNATTLGKGVLCGSYKGTSAYCLESCSNSQQHLADKVTSLCEVGLSCCTDVPAGNNPNGNGNLVNNGNTVNYAKKPAWYSELSNPLTDFSLMGQVPQTINLYKKFKIGSNIKEATGGGKTGNLFKLKLGIGGNIVFAATELAATFEASRLTSKLFESFGGSKASPVAKNLLGTLGQGVGAFATSYTLLKLFPNAGLSKLLGSNLLKVLGGPLGVSAIAAGAALIYAFFTFKSVAKQGTVVYYCNQWQAPTGGSKCDLCNHQDVPCSIYQCKSLGQSCAFIQSDSNNGGKPYCFWNNSNSITPPKISPNPAVLDIGYKYTNQNSRGVTIASNTTDGCISPFTNILIGVTTDELSQCKFTVMNRPENYKDMAAYMGGSSLAFNHTTVLQIPQINQSGGNQNQASVYVMCQNPNGNADTTSFEFNMCMQKGPDLTPPSVKEANPLNNSYVQYGTTNMSVDFYINKPSTCKWSFKPNQDYSAMPYNMSCETSPLYANTLLSYTCSTNLTGIQKNKNTKYYIKCENNPGTNTSRNPMVQDYVYTLQPSSNLVIKSVTPNDTVIKSSSDSVNVNVTATTIGGAKDGNATCSYSPTGALGSYQIFDNTHSYTHSTLIEPSLGDGSYNYFVNCIDDAGNSATKEINFNVSLDHSAPVVSRAYYSENSLKFITNEKALCEYSTSGCDYSFGDGVNITSSDGLTQTLPWNPQSSYYIKCEDIYGNQPASGQCSIVLRAQNQTY